MVGTVTHKQNESDWKAEARQASRHLNKPRKPKGLPVKEVERQLKGQKIDVVSFAFEREIETLASQVTGKPLQLRYSLADRIRLLNLRAFSIMLQWPMDHLLKTLFGKWTAGGKKQYKSSHGLLPVPPVVLASDKTLEFLRTYKTAHPGEVEDLFYSREATKAEMLIRQFCREHGPQSKTNPKLSPMENHRANVEAARKFTDRMNEQFRNRKFPGNPWRVWKDAGHGGTL